MDHVLVVACRPPRWRVKFNALSLLSSMTTTFRSLRVNENAKDQYTGEGGHSESEKARVHIVTLGLAELTAYHTSELYRPVRSGLY